MSWRPGRPGPADVSRRIPLRAVTSAVTETEPGAGAAPQPHARRAAAPAAVPATVVLFATAAGEEGGPAAAQRWDGGTVLGRLLDQFVALGVTGIHVVTRRPWVPALEPSLGDREASVRVHASDSAAEDLRTVAEIARASAGPVVVGYADIVTQAEVLAGLLMDPRVATGILITVGRLARPFGSRVRSRRGRVLSAGSPYHSVRAPNGTFLGIFRVAPADRERFIAIAERLAALLEGQLPEGWEEELAAKTAKWRRILATDASLLHADSDGDVEEKEVEVEVEAELLDHRGGRGPGPLARGGGRGRAPARGRRAGRDRAPARRAHPLQRPRQGQVALPDLFWARPRWKRDWRARSEVPGYDEHRALLDAG